jgi:hypothetical protein
MSGGAGGTGGTGGEAPDSGLAATLRFLTELIAWLATPWALASWSVPVAVTAVIVLIGLPTVFATPGDKARPVVAVPGPVTIAQVLLQLAAAVTAAWFAWPTLVAIAVTLLVLATLITEQPRWRWLRTAPR